MVFCEVITKFSLDDRQNLENFVSERSRIFTNDPNILDELSQFGYEIKLIDNYFGLFNEKINKINDKAVSKFYVLKEKSYQNEIKKYNFHENLRYFHLQRLIFLEIIYEILKEIKNVVFIFSNSSFHYFSILDIAKEMGYSTKNGIVSFSENKIKTNFFHEERKSKLNEIQIKLKEIDRFNSMMITDSYQTRIEDITINESKPKFAFFLINNITDFYLKPVYPILKKFKESNKEFSIFTFDLLTYTQLSQKGFKPNDLSEYLDEVSLKEFKIKQVIQRDKLLPATSSFHKTMKAMEDSIVHKETIGPLSKKRVNRKRENRRLSLLKRRLRWKRRKIVLKRKYRRMNRRLLHWYFTRLQYYNFIRWIVSRKFIKKKIMRVVGLIEDEFIVDVPEKEMRTILNVVNEVVKEPTNDLVLKSYLNYFEDDYVVNQIANNLAIYTILDLIFKKYRFSTVFVAMDGSPNNNTVCTIAQKYNIPTFSLPQIFIRINKIQVALPSATKIFLSGTKIKKELIKLGTDENRLIITGNPRYDSLKVKPKEETSLLSSINKIFKKNEEFFNDLIIIAMSRWHENDYNWMSKVIKFCNQENLDILIKIHPMYKSPINYGTSKEQVNNIKKECKGLKFTISYDIDLSKVWRNTKVLITEHSIVAVEAALSNIPIIVTDIGNEENFEGLEYQKEGIALYAKSYKEITSCIKKILNDKVTREKLDKSMERFCNDYNYLNDGYSTERIYNILTEENKN